MANQQVTVETDPPDLFQRMQNYPNKQDDEIREAMGESLQEIGKAVPKYAPKLPNQRYVRTERLGRSIGSGFSGGSHGFPDIHTVKRIGSGTYEADYGSRLNYAADVIGEGTQKPIFEGRWWTDLTLAKRATAKINQVFNKMTERLASWLNGSNL